MKLNTKNTIKGLSLLLISCGLLTACNQTGSSANTSAANATQAANQAQTEKYLRVVNKTGSTIDNLSVFSESGQLLYRSSTGLNCADQQSCNIDIKSLITAETMLAKFYNSKNQLVSMSSLQSNTQKLAFSTVYTNNTIFGAHLFSQLISFQKSNKQSINAPDLLQKLNQLFKNQKDSINVFEELGAYYSQQLSQGKIHNENDFYTHLNNDLASGKSLTVKVPVLTATKQLLQTPRLGCDHAAADMSAKIFKTAAPFVGTIPVFGSIISGGLNGWAAVAQDICPSEQFDIAGSIAQINEKLETLQQSVKQLTNDVQELKDIIDETTLKSLMTKMNDFYLQDNSFIEGYGGFLNSNVVEDETKQPISITEYVNSYGGLDNLNKDKYVALYKQLNSLEQEKVILDEMSSTPRLAEITSAIQNICAK